MIHPAESFSAEEASRLAPHFTNLDRPVFALVNLPETVKGALFARYSRYPGTLRRLFLDEFAGSLPEPAAALQGRLVPRLAARAARDRRGERGPPRRGAVRAHLPRVRRQLGRPARRHTRRGRV